VCGAAGAVCDAVAGAPGDETCDGTDEDCDGPIDEGAGGRPLQRACQAPDNQVGMGQCAAGESRCVDGVWGVCVGEVVATDEACDGVDQDCDGRVDEGRVPCFDGPPERAEVGACRPGRAVCGPDGPEACVGAIVPAPEVCPGVDEDCDGEVDEAEPPTPCTVGVGACQREGILVCGPDGPVCDAVAGDPTPEICNEIDDDCDGVIDPPPVCDLFATCRVAQAAGRTESGVYRLRPGPDLSTWTVWCDQVTDGGGWTLVASSRGRPPGDAAVSGFEDLQTLSPARANPGIWAGLRDVDVRFDVRFACRAGRDPQAPWTVDLSVYGVSWYPRWTVGEDADSCLDEGPIDPPPARRNDRTGRYLPRGQAWAGGRLEWEDSCDDSQDFAFDFNDGGLHGNPADGTDWGQANGVKRCGGPVGDGAWFIFVREASRWVPEGSFQVAEGPRRYPRGEPEADVDAEVDEQDAAEPEGPVAWSCRQRCMVDAGLEAEGVRAAFACSSRPDRLDRRAWLDGFGDEQYCRGPQALAPDAFVLPAEGQPYFCNAPGCAYSAWINDHGCAARNHCWRAFAPPVFVPPAPGSTGNLGGLPWQICAADAATAWVAGTEEGAYPAAEICEGLGYTSVEAWGTTCGNVCGFCDEAGHFESEGDGTLLAGWVHWRCAR